MTRILLTTLVLISIVSCTQTGSLDEADKKNIIADVNRTLNEYLNDIRKDGLKAEFKYLDHSTEFFWVPPGYSLAIGYDSVANVLKQNAGKYKTIDNRFDSLKIVPLSRELANYTARLRSVMTDTSGKSFSLSLVETGILIKRKSGWKLLSGQTTVIDQ